MSNKTLALCRTAPYGNALAREGLEAILASAAMEQEIDTLFLGDGIFQLLNNQEPAEIGQKNLHRNLQALPMFDVEQFFVCGKSLAERGINPEEIQIPGVEITVVEETGSLIATYQCVLSF